MDDRTVAAAIATRLGATTPPTGQESIKVATADFPDGLTFFPFLLVGMSDMEAVSFISKRRSLTVEYPAVLYLGKSDGTPRRTRAIRDWKTALYGRLSGQMQLGGLTYVTWAEIVAWSNGASYGGEDYDAVTFTCRVNINEQSGAAA